MSSHSQSLFQREEGGIDVTFYKETEAMKTQTNPTEKWGGETRKLPSPCSLNDCSRRETDCQSHRRVLGLWKWKLRLGQAEERALGQPGQCMSGPSAGDGATGMRPQSQALAVSSREPHVACVSADAVWADLLAQGSSEREDK